MTGRCCCGAAGPGARFHVLARGYPAYVTERDEGASRSSDWEATLSPDERRAATLDALSDEELRQRIDDLVDERERRMQLADHDATARLDIELDQLWDLLRQRRARHDAGNDPSLAHVRPATVVEGYEQ